MKKILLSDRGKVKETSILCDKYNVGIDAGSFRDYNISKHNPNTINEILSSYENTAIYSIHGTIADLIFESSIIKRTKKRFEAIYGFSEKLNCKNIVFHNGYVPGASKPEKWIKDAKVFWDEYLKNKDTETIFYLENFLETSPYIIINLIEEVNKNNLKMCFDIGHANIYSKIEIMKWIEIAYKNIGFVHLHNNDGRTDSHDGLNNGVINILEICKALEHYCPDAIWALETKELETSINWLRLNNFYK